MRLPPSIQLAVVPTPIERLDRIADELGGPRLYVKRDDLTGCPLSGNKVRKLELLAADALAKRADILVTCGGIQSNHARATALVASRLGLDCLLVLKGEPPDELDGNLLLDRLAGAEVRFVSVEEYEENIDKITEGIASELRRRGRTPYIIPEGGSNGLGALAYVKAVGEIRKQSIELGVDFDQIVTAVGSGGTYAGLLMGTRVHHLPSRIIGFNVCRNAQHFVGRIEAIVRECKELFELDVHLRTSDIEIVDGYVGRGYAQSRPEEIELIKWVARTEGLILDPVYTAKAMLGLVDLIRGGRLGRENRVLFVHTGGIFGLFGKGDLFSELNPDQETNQLSGGNQTCSF